MKRAVVFDNSGTLIERYRVIKDVSTGKVFTDINSLDLIDAADSLALVVLQFNTKKLLELDPDTLISDVIRDFEIGQLIDKGEGATFELIEKMDEIRKMIGDYEHEKVIDEGEEA